MITKPFIANSFTSMIAISIMEKVHRNNSYIFIDVPYQKNINEAIRKVAHSKWSNTHKQWYIPKSPEAIQALALHTHGIATITKTHATDALTQPTKRIGTATLSVDNAKALQQYKQHLILKAYSPATQKTYTNEFYAYLQTLQQVSAASISYERLQNYFAYCATTLQLSENTIHSRINALKFYYEQVLQRASFFWNIPRPKKPLQLPKHFAKEEIEQILKHTENCKHYTILMLCYSSGLRVSEVVSLQISDIDSKRMVIHINKSKGKKDRIVPLSKVALAQLKKYYTAYKPKHYLFEGQQAGSMYTARSVQMILDKAKQKANIVRKGSVHALRHSYATHLLDKGVDITYISKILGHNDLKTTLRYLHVSNKDINKIQSPLDDLNL